MEILQPSLSAALVVVIYILLDRVVVPLVKGKASNGNGRNKNGTVAHRNDQQQQLVNEITNRRMDKLESELGENRQAIADVGTAVAVIKAIVERIEARLK